MIRSARRPAKNSRNISSVSMQSWKPARRALIVLVILSKKRLKMASANCQEATRSKEFGCRLCFRTISPQTSDLSAI